MNIFPWIKPPGASVAELEAQLAAARDAARITEEAVATALSDFDLDPSTKTEKALAEARSLAASASEHEGRALRLLEGARAKEAEANLERLQRERDAIVGELAELRRIEQEDLVLAEAEMWIEIARHRTKRELHGRTVSECESRLFENHKALGGDPEGRPLSQVDAIQPPTYSRGAPAVFFALEEILKSGRFADPDEHKAVYQVARELKVGFYRRNL
jgi:hypothetical protein